mgnify:CR=1 FL=1
MITGITQVVGAIEASQFINGTMIGLLGCISVAFLTGIGST